MASKKKPSCEPLSSITNRLEKIFTEYLGTAEKMNLSITGDHLLQVIDFALTYAKGGEVKGFEKTSEGYFCEGLLEELLQQPTSVLESRKDENGHINYVPLETNLWIECLETFQIRLQNLMSDQTVAQKKSETKHSHHSGCHCCDNDPIRELFRKRL